MESGSRDFERRQDAGWRAQLDSAKSEAQVLQLCVDFLSHWTSHRRAALPDACQPPLRMHTSAQVAEYALTLAQARLLDDNHTPELLAMTAYFVAASARLSQLLASASSSMRVPFFTRDPQ